MSVEVTAVNVDAAAKAMQTYKNKLKKHSSRGVVLMGREIAGAAAAAGGDGAGAGRSREPGQARARGRRDAGGRRP